MIKIIRDCGQPSTELYRRVKPTADVSAVVSTIISEIRAMGDQALKKYTERFDGAKLDNLQVTEAEFSEAEASVDEEFKSILKEAASNIREFHTKQLRSGFSIAKSGSVLGQRVLPLERVGIYVPGGTAAYPSTVLMNAIPASIAGCEDIVIVTPPSKDGKIKAEILVAAKLAGVTKVFKCGGAQAVAALAYGTESVPKVDKIVGPGNQFVAEAKRQVFGEVGIDMIAGPSEILIIADNSAQADYVASDMLSQAEHDRLASAILLTNSEKLASAVAGEIDRQLELLERSEIASASIESNGRIIICDSMERAIELSNEIAPEHLEICTRAPFDMLGEIKNAGSVFLGNYCPEPLGDYFAGPNHTLPTSGTARFSSPLSVDDFVKKMQFSYYSDDAFAVVAEKVAEFARREGLTAHAMSAETRLKK